MNEKIRFYDKSLMDLAIYREHFVWVLQTTLLLFLFILVFILILDDPIALFYLLEMIIKNTGWSVTQEVQWWSVSWKCSISLRQVY